MLSSRFVLSYVIYHQKGLFFKSTRSVASLTSGQITDILARDEIHIANSNSLPSCVKSIQCNQLASNDPIEDRIRIASLNLPGFKEPTLVLGVFDGHGGETNVDLVSSRLFRYIALSLHPEPNRLNTTDLGDLNRLVVNLHTSPQPLEHPSLDAAALKSLSVYKSQVASDAGIATRLTDSFRRCDDDLSREIQENLLNPNSSTGILHYYLSAAVSGCCALVMVIHQGIGYLASTGDCRAVLGILSPESATKSGDDANSLGPAKPHRFSTLELNDEHNCDNIGEIRRLAASHPKSEQNTMIRHNRLLGHLMPFRAFGDFTYKWPADLTKKCGVTKAYGSGVIPPYYETPPYLIVEPDVRELEIKESPQDLGFVKNNQRTIVIASDGLWELFESSRDVIEAVVDHSENSNIESRKGDYDANCATYILRSALRSGTQPESDRNREELERLYHVRLESMLTLPASISRNFRDDISIIVLKLQ